MVWDGEWPFSPTGVVRVVIDGVEATVPGLPQPGSHLWWIEKSSLYPLARKDPLFYDIRREEGQVARSLGDIFGVVPEERLVTVKV
jgi:hypothetical protein